MKNPSPLILREQRMFERAQREEDRQAQERLRQQERQNLLLSQLPPKPPSYAQSVERRARNLHHQARGVPYHSRGMTYDRSRDPRLRRQPTGKKDASQKPDPVDELIKMMSGMGSRGSTGSTTRTRPSGNGRRGISASGTTREGAGTSNRSNTTNRNTSGDEEDRTSLKGATQPNTAPTSTLAPSSHDLWSLFSTPSSFRAAAASVSSTYVPVSASFSEPVSSTQVPTPPPGPDTSGNAEDTLTQLLREAISSSGVASYPDPSTYPSTALGGVPTPPSSPPKDIKVQPAPAPSTNHHVESKSQESQVVPQVQITLPTIPTISTISPIPAPPQPSIPSVPHLSTQPSPFTGPTRTIKTIHLLHTVSPYARHRPNYQPDECSLNSNTPWDAFIMAQDMHDPITLDWNACQDASDPERSALALAHLDRAVERHYWTERWLKSFEMDGLDLDGNGVDDFVENGNLPPLTMLIPEEIKPIIFQRLCDLDDALTPLGLLTARLDATSDPRPVVARAYMISDEARHRYRYIYKGFRLLAVQLLGCRKMDELFPTVLDWDADLII